jgi:hypothetical protein
MKQLLIIIGLLLLLFIGGYIAVIKVTMPKAARAFIPVKWQNVPLGQNKKVMHEYLGEPDTVINGREYWEQHLSSMKKYVLDVAYRGDTASASYRVIYEVEIMGMKQVTDVQADTLQ